MLRSACPTIQPAIGSCAICWEQKNSCVPVRSCNAKGYSWICLRTVLSSFILSRMKFKELDLGSDHGLASRIDTRSGFTGIELLFVVASGSQSLQLQLAHRPSGPGYRLVAPRYCSPAVRRSPPSEDRCPVQG